MVFSNAEILRGEFHIKRFLSYFVPTVGFAIVFYLGTAYKMRLLDNGRETFNLLPFVVFVSFFSILIGILLRLPKLMKEMKENKQWSFDWIKFLAIGLPMLYLALIPLLSLNFGIRFLLFTKTFLMTGDTTLPSIAGIVFGYVLLDSFKK